MTSALQNETDEMAFDPDAGLAITHRGRPIAACAPDTTEAKRYAPTPIDVVRQRRRARVEAELSRLLYVAMTRAKEYLYVVNTEAEDRGLSLRRLLWRARDQNPERFNALLPTSRGKLPRHYNF
jgi:ATP-dependent exoDNAse (exonuclease V) beta subunit